MTLTFIQGCTSISDRLNKPPFEADLLLPSFGCMFKSWITHYPETIHESVGWPSWTWPLPRLRAIAPDMWLPGEWTGPTRGRWPKEGKAVYRPRSCPAHPASLKFDATTASGVILEKWLNFRNSHSGAIRKPSLLWAGLVRTREWSSCRFYVCTQGPKVLGLDGVMRISSG